MSFGNWAKVICKLIPLAVEMAQHVYRPIQKQIVNDCIPIMFNESSKQMRAESASSSGKNNFFSLEKTLYLR